jgi:hypothetical protein
MPIILKHDHEFTKLLRNNLAERLKTFEEDGRPSGAC